MDAEGVFFSKLRDDDGFIIEIAVWQVPHAVPGSSHRYKYRLFFGVPGRRIVGFDNERGKGDHRHRDGEETSYDFVDLDTLLRDFEVEIEKWRSAQ
jgi:hypothetical protein